MVQSIDNPVELRYEPLAKIERDAEAAVFGDRASVPEAYRV